MTVEQQIRAYHQLSMHQPENFAPGPGQLEWATQPAAFRRYAGARLIELQRRPLEQSVDYDSVFAAPLGEPAPLNPASVAQLLYDSLALSDRKSTRLNSSHSQIS